MRESCNAFVEDNTQKHEDGSLNEWKRKIRRLSVCVLLEVADTGCFQWKLFLSKKICCSDDTMESLRQQYLTFLQTKNFEKKTIALYDYAFRSFIKGAGVTDVSGLRELQTAQIQSLLVFLSERLCLNSRGTVFPIIRQILSYLYTAGFIPTDFSGMILTPAYKKTHLRPYITASDEKKLFRAMEEAPLRTKAMMRLGLRLGLRDIGHMIAQIIEAWETLWKKVKQSRTQKHRLLLNAWKNSRIKENSSEMEKKIQVRFAYS